jgi:hypothetical protein
VCSVMASCFIASFHTVTTSSGSWMRPFVREIVPAVDQSPVRIPNARAARTYSDCG